MKSKQELGDAINQYRKLWDYFRNEGLERIQIDEGYRIGHLFSKSLDMSDIFYCNGCPKVDNKDKIMSESVPTSQPKITQEGPLYRRRLGEVSRLNILMYPLIGYCSASFQLPAAEIFDNNNYRIGVVQTHEILCQDLRKFIKGPNMDLMLGPKIEYLEPVLEVQYKPQLKQIAKQKKLKLTDLKVDPYFQCFKTKTLPVEETVRIVGEIFRKIYHFENLPKPFGNMKR